MSDIDPFASDKRPSVSLKEVPVGGIVEMTVNDTANMVQSRDFETGEPAYWDEARTQPKMSAVLNVTHDGEERALWAQKPSALFSAIVDAQQTAGVQIGKPAGGKLSLKRLDDKPNSKNPRLNPAKQWAAKYEPAAADAFGDDDKPPF